MRINNQALNQGCDNHEKAHIVGFFINCFTESMDLCSENLPYLIKILNMGSLLIAVFVFAVVVGVKHKAQHHDSDLPDSVISGSKAFGQDLLAVLKSLKPSKKEKGEGEKEVPELPKGESEEKPTE